MALALPENQIVKKCALLSATRCAAACAPNTFAVDVKLDYIFMDTQVAKWTTTSSHEVWDGRGVKRWLSRAITGQQRTVHETHQHAERRGKKITNHATITVFIADTSRTFTAESIGKLNELTHSLTDIVIDASIWQLLAGQVAADGTAQQVVELPGSNTSWPVGGLTPAAFPQLLGMDVGVAA
eukprot:TRINITY_DN14699_c0_g1_i1.p1 TRINITY_DN14699_c0_g1~~TRINITY_DN14699_c0_g1_i1.p1  ORF type:complete len:183 (+),score=40.63 TRINITY_DN14699_c0_g1_i1:78-626(+)